MNGFTEHVSGASERRGLSDRLLTWGEAQAMLPLVGRIAKDVMRYSKRLAEISPERDRLERQRHKLDWPGRQRRYQIHEEILATDKELLQLEAELETLGVAILEPETGLVGFPTMVNNRAAYFSWRPEEESLSYWNFADDTARRSIPEDWTKPAETEKRRAKSRK